MRWFKILLYIIVILILQTVILPRLNFFGVIPDLILVSVVIFSIQAEAPLALTFALSLGLVQDSFAGGLYLNAILKVILSAVVVRLKEKYLGNEREFTFGLVAVLTPVYLISEALIYLFFFHQSVGTFGSFILRLVFSTLYNLIMAALLRSLIRGLDHE